MNKITEGGPRVLLIDDSELSAHLARDVLTTAGFDARAATTLTDFESILETWSPGIVLTDVNMPEIGGPDLCRRLKARLGAAQVPVVLFSTLPEAELKSLARSCGADDYLSKASIQRLPWLLRALWESGRVGAPRRLSDLAASLESILERQEGREPPARTRKVLVVDDSELAAELAREYLALSGYEARTATSMPRFDAVLRQWKPDLILMDVNMPGMSGAELCRELKARFATAPVPVLLHSSLPSAELQKLADQVGADGFVSKRDGVSVLAERLDLLSDSILW